MAILQRLEDAPQIWAGEPAELDGREAEVISWILVGLHTFRQQNINKPASDDARTMQRWAASLDGTGATPGFIAGQIAFVLKASDEVKAAMSAATVAGSGTGWYGEPDIRPQDVYQAFRTLAEIMMFFQRLEGKRQAALNRSPSIGRRGNSSARERFVHRWLSMRIEAECSGKYDAFAATLIGTAFGRPHGLTAETSRDRRRRNARAESHGKNGASKSL
jgi:hypothetical protein